MVLLGTVTERESRDCSVRGNGEGNVGREGEMIDKRNYLFPGKPNNVRNTSSAPLQTEPDECHSISTSKTKDCDLRNNNHHMTISMHELAGLDIPLTA
jgi:hypothetical protein